MNVKIPRLTLWQGVLLAILAVGMYATVIRCRKHFHYGNDIAFLFQAMGLLRREKITGHLIRTFVLEPSLQSEIESSEGEIYVFHFEQAAD